MAATCSVPGIRSGGGHGCSPAPGTVAPCSRYRVDGGRLFCTRYPFRRWPWVQPYNTAPGINERFSHTTLRAKNRVDGSHLFSTRHPFRRWPWEPPYNTAPGINERFSHTTQRAKNRVDGGHLFCTWHPFRRWPRVQPRAWIRGTVQPVPRRWRPPVLYLVPIQAVAVGATIQHRARNQ